MLASMWLAAGCGSIPETHYYVLGAPPAAAAAAPAGDLRIGVDGFTADPPYDQDLLVYRIGGDASEIRFYNYHRWAGPPGRLIQAALSDGLHGLAGASFEPITLTGDYDARLEGRVVLIEEVDRADGELARLRLVLRLVDPGGGVLWSRDVGAEVAGQAESVADVVDQMRRALAEVIAEIRDGLGEAVRGLAADPPP